MDGVATRLKRLREAAVPPLSVRQMAEQLGIDHSTYVHYENANRFKKSNLPIELARKIAAVLADHGVDPALVMALAGVGESEGPDLSAGEEQLLDTFRDLGPEQRALLLQLANQMRASRPSDTPPNSSASATVTSGARKFRREPEEQV